jgi:hypothetical protein
MKEVLFSSIVRVILLRDLVLVFEQACETILAQRPHIILAKRLKLADTS